jgi:hypothetical protein
VTRSVLSRPLRVFAAFALAFATACSLFIPFDDYPGPPRSDAMTASDAAAEGDGGDEAGAECEGIDIQNDPMNCGGCSRQCGAGGACVKGRCPVDEVVDVGTAAGAVAWMGVASVVTADGGAGDHYLYVTTAGGILGRVNLALTPASPIESSPATGANGAGDVGNRLGVFAVGTTSLGYFRHTTFATTAENVTQLRSGVGPVALGPSNDVYWGEDGGIRWGKIRADASVAGWDGDRPVALATIQDRILWATEDGTTFEMSSTSPGNPTRLLDGGLHGSQGLAVTNTRLFVCQKSQGVHVFVWNSATDTATFRRKVTLDDPTSVVTDGDYIYVLDRGNGAPRRAELHRATVDGTQSIILADGLDPASGLAVFGDWVYFASGERVLRTSK